MSRENAFLLMLAILLFASVISLSALGVQNIGAYVSLLTLCYFANSFIFKPKRKTIDFVGLGLLYYAGLFLAIAFKVL